MPLVTLDAPIPFTSSEPMDIDPEIIGDGGPYQPPMN